jgi:Family of unknown function (DUF5338)
MLPPHAPQPERRMSPPRDQKRMKGIGRVAFLAQLAEITAELDAGWPIKAVYDNRKQRMGISYAQFTRYVDQIVRNHDAPAAAHHAIVTSQPVRDRPRHEPSPPPLPSAAAPPPTIPPVPPQGSSRAGHVPPSRTFNHDPIERPDDRRRLLGEA